MSESAFTEFVVAQLLRLIGRIQRESGDNKLLHIVAIMKIQLQRTSRLSDIDPEYIDLLLPYAERFEPEIVPSLHMVLSIMSKEREAATAEETIFLEPIAAAA
jgi:hypothetical protein